MTSKHFRLSLLASGIAIVFLLVTAATESSPKQITFTKDVAPILFKNCAECHRPGEIAPMSLLTYQEVRPWARSIRERVLDGSMPPWSADPKVGHWANDPRLSPQEIETITQWVAAGSLKGDDKDLPPVPKFPEGWTIGKPDVVLEMAEEYTVPAEGTIPYLYFEMPTNFTEDKWIQAVEIRPSNRSVVHHVIAYSQDGNARDIRPGAEGETRGGRVQLSGVTPNKTGVTFDPGTAKLIRKGSKIVFQMHYTTNGAVGKDRTKIGLIFAKAPPKFEIQTSNAINTSFAIPAGNGNYEVKSSRRMERDALITSFSPHMHVRGKSFNYTATYPDGRVEVLLNVPKFDFNWQHNYLPAKPIFVPKGTRIDCVAFFDNSARNKFNPDPAQTVRWGDQTWEEMMIGWFTYVPAEAQPAKPVSASSSTSGQ